MMKNFKYYFSFCIILVGCTKEVGKKEYELVFTFSSNEECIFNSYIFEKTKKYENQDANYYVGQKNIGNQIYVESNSQDGKKKSLVLFKTEADYLAGINQIEKWKVPNASFALNYDAEISGIIDMNGSYEKKGRKFIVEKGTFTIDWTNAADYGQPVQELTGTWSLRRK